MEPSTPKRRLSDRERDLHLLGLDASALYEDVEAACATLLKKATTDARRHVQDARDRLVYADLSGEHPFGSPLEPEPAPTASEDANEVDNADRCQPQRAPSTADGIPPCPSRRRRIALAATVVQGVATLVMLGVVFWPGTRSRDKEPSRTRDPEPTAPVPVAASQPPRIIAEASVDVNGDGRPERVTMRQREVSIAPVATEGLPAVGLDRPQMEVIVSCDGRDTILFSDLYQTAWTGVHDEVDPLVLADVTGDGRPEILFYSADIGGSGGTVEFHAFRADRGRFVSMIDPERPIFGLIPFHVEVRPATGRKANKMYVYEHLYEEGRWEGVAQADRTFPFRVYRLVWDGKGLRPRRSFRTRGSPGVWEEAQSELEARGLMPPIPRPASSR